VQNFGIIFGAVFALMLAGTFGEKFMAGLKISAKGILLYAVGGFIMGFGTRLSNGCNVCTLYTYRSIFTLRMVLPGHCGSRRIYGKLVVKKIQTSLNF